MLLHETSDQRWSARAALLADRPGGTAVIVDGNGRLEPLLAAAEEHRVTLAAVLLTHEHEDHVDGIAELASAHPDLAVLAHPAAGRALPFETRAVRDGDEVAFGDLSVRVIGIPGHAAGQVAYWVDGHCATGDSLFRGTVATHEEPGQASFDAHRASVERLLVLPADTVLLPGHGAATTAGAERRGNPFARAWRGELELGDTPCRVGGPFGLWPAALRLLVTDYDGGGKAWVRFPRLGDAVVPGSQLYTMDGRPWASASRAA
jgi:hydroxyacylglutathione hydrolase